MLRQSQSWSQNVTDRGGGGEQRGRVAELEGGGQAGVGEMRSWVKAPKLPRHLCERHSAEKIDNMCPLCRGMPKTMTSSSSKLARTRGERPGLTHGSFIHYYSLSYSSFFLALRLSLCTDSDNEVFIFKNLKNKIVLSSAYSQTIR